MEDRVAERLFPDRGPPSFFLRARWKIERIWTFLRNIPSNIVMICQWIPILWNNWDWDYIYLFNVIQYKTKRMSKHIRECGHLEKSDEIADEINECVEIIQRIKENDYVSEEHIAHNEKWGESICDFVPCKDSDCSTLDMYTVKAREQGLEEKERQEMFAIYDLATKREEEDFDRLFKLLRNKVQSWWD